MADETKTVTAQDKREALIREKMRKGNMTRENAELVLLHQEQEDAKRAKKAKQ